ncbi:hypothetical protein IJ182_10910 [bacterium]|nr:hypothetical protein [bacterium]
MKNFILALGRFFVNVGIIIQLIAALFISIIVGICISSLDYSTNGLNIFVGIGTFIVLFIFIIMCNFLLYLVINMHDSFISMAESLKIIANDKKQ